MLILKQAKEYLFELCLVGLLIKSMIAGATIADSLVLISLVISVCYAKYYLVKKQADFTETQVEMIQDASKKVNGIIAAQAFRRDSNVQKK